MSILNRISSVLIAAITAVIPVCLVGCNSGGEQVYFENEPIKSLYVPAGYTHVFDEESDRFSVSLHSDTDGYISILLMLKSSPEAIDELNLLMSIRESGREVEPEEYSSPSRPDSWQVREGLERGKAIAMCVMDNDDLWISLVFVTPAEEEFDWKDFIDRIDY